VLFKFNQMFSGLFFFFYWQFVVASSFIVVVVAAAVVVEIDQENLQTKTLKSKRYVFGNPLNCRKSCWFHNKWNCYVNSILCLFLPKFLLNLIDFSNPIPSRHSLIVLQLNEPNQYNVHSIWIIPKM